VIVVGAGLVPALGEGVRGTGGLGAKPPVPLSSRGLAQPGRGDLYSGLAAFRDYRLSPATPGDV